MKQYVGIEAVSLIEDLPEFLEIFHKITDPIYTYNRIYIYSTDKDGLEAADFLREAELFEDSHSLIKMDAGKEGTDFYDNGFKVDAKVFLFKNSLSAFIISGEDKIQAEAAVLQLEEHLVYSNIDSKGRTVFFFNSNYKELVMGIAKAYDIDIMFLNLDK